MMHILKKEKNFLLFLFFFSFLVRALVFALYLGKNDNFWQVDSNTYHITATQVAQGNGFAKATGQPNFYRLPGYPLFIAAYYKLFGEDKKNVLWWQIFIAAFIPLFIFLLSLTLFPAKMLLAKLASLYSCIHLGLVLYSGFFMTETLFIFFLLIFFALFFSATHLFFCTTNKVGKKSKSCSRSFNPPIVPEAIGIGPSFIRFYEESHKKEISKQQQCYLESSEKTQHRYQLLLLAGLTLGLASLVRPVGHYLIVVALLMLFFSKNLWEDRIGKSIVLFFGWVTPVLFWLIRNYLLTGYIFLHTLPGGHFLYLSAARTAMHVHNTTYEHAREILKKKVEKIRKKKEKKLHRFLSDIEMCRVREKLAVTYFLKRPFITLKNWSTDMFRTCFSLFSAELLYLDSGRKKIDYFKKERTLWSMFKRYLFPETKNRWLKIIIWIEILLFFFMLLGFLLFAWSAIFKFFRFKCTTPPCTLCILFKALPFMALFIVVSLAGGYARMRLPIEPFLIIFAFKGWSHLVTKTT